MHLSTLLPAYPPPSPLPRPHPGGINTMFVELSHFCSGWLHRQQQFSTPRHLHSCRMTSGSKYCWLSLKKPSLRLRGSTPSGCESCIGTRTWLFLPIQRRDDGKGEVVMSRLAPQGVNVKAAHERYPRNYEVSKWMRPFGNLDDCSPTHPIPCYAHGWCFFVVARILVSVLSSDFVYISLSYISRLFPLLLLLRCLCAGIGGLHRFGRASTSHLGDMRQCPVACCACRQYRRIHRHYLKRIPKLLRS